MYQMSKSTDVDECKNENGGCEHHCQNLPGDHQCFCSDGYTINTDNKTCEGKYYFSYVLISHLVLIIIPYLFMIYFTYYITYNNNRIRRISLHLKDKQK